MPKRVVLALGGNALLDPEKPQTWQNMERKIRNTVQHVVSLIHQDVELIITHGNGPQVGDALLKDYAVENELRYPLYVHDAETQAQIGLLLQNTIQEIAPKVKIATVLTRILVDRKDPAFQHPSKPVGPEYIKKPNIGGSIEEIEPGRYRQVVASPMPRKILDIGTIKVLLRENIIPIACGGGGIPVIKENGQIKGIDAVIDKDFASALLAKEIDADILLIATDVPGIAKNYGKENQTWIKEIQSTELRRMLNTFPEGSMKPKAQAAIDFVESTGKVAIICALEDIDKAISGDRGTIVRK